MGLSSKQVNGNTSTDHDLDWSRTLLQTQANLEISKPSSMRRIQQQQQNQNNQQNSEVLKCPRCDSTNTKFCYYNNYNKTQPRHFCRTCKRHWTKGGTLRNVPVGGGRKNKKTKKPPTSNSVSASSQMNVNIVKLDNRVSTQMIFQPQNQTQSLPLLYQAMVSVSPQQSLITTAEPFAQKQSMNFPFPSVTSFDSNLVSVTIPFQNSSSCFYNPEEFKINGESSIDIPTTSMINNTVTEKPIWQVPITSNSGTDVSNNWNWEDIDSLVSTDHINLAWDDSDIKP